MPTFADVSVRHYPLDSPVGTRLLDISWGSIRLVSWIVKAKSAPNAAAGLSAPYRSPEGFLNGADARRGGEGVGVSGLQPRFGGGAIRPVARAHPNDR